MSSLSSVIDSVIERWILEEVGEDDLRAPIRYMTTDSGAAGKRIRPQLAYAVYTDCGGLSIQAVAPALAALEMMHTATLIHDDLPALDNDDYRRGRLSCHKQFSEPIAILTGDCLMTGAITVLGTLPFNSNVVSDTIRYLCGAITAVNRGQAWDLRRTPNDNLRGLYRLKTGALFRAALVIGARLALNSSCLEDSRDSCGNSDEVIAVLGRLGDEIGILFQLLDDLIDKTDEKGRLGLSSDLRLEKKTISEIDSEIASECVVTTIRGIFGAFDDLTRLGVVIEKIRAIIDPLITKITNLTVGSNTELIDSNI